MINKEVKEKALYFDVETASCFESLETLNERNPRLAEILNKTNKILNNAHSKGWKLCGHNIKGFDIACLGKRMLYNGITPSQNIQVWDKKPWEMPFLDTAEIFSFGNWMGQKYLGLDLLACSLNVRSPKEDIKGSDVSRVFWIDKDFHKIKEYCERDVETVMLIMDKISV